MPARWSSVRNTAARSSPNFHTLMVPSFDAVISVPCGVKLTDVTESR